MNPAQLHLVHHHPPVGCTAFTVLLLVVTRLGKNEQVDRVSFVLPCSSPFCATARQLEILN